MTMSAGHLRPRHGEHFKTKQSRRYLCAGLCGARRLTHVPSMRLWVKSLVLCFQSAQTTKVRVSRCARLCTLCQLSEFTSLVCLCIACLCARVCVSVGVRACVCARVCARACARTRPVCARVWVFVVSMVAHLPPVCN